MQKKRVPKKKHKDDILVDVWKRQEVWMLSKTRVDRDWHLGS